MKKFLPFLAPFFLLFFAVPAAAAAEITDTLTAQYAFMKPALMVLFAVSGILLIASLVLLVMTIIRKHRNVLLLVVLILATAVSIFCSNYCLTQYRTIQETLNAAREEAESATTAPTTTPTTAPTTVPTTEATTEPTTEPTTQPTTEPDPTYSASPVDLSDPEQWGIDWDIMAYGSTVESFERTEPISFGIGSEYSALEGVITFRGDNYRSGPTFGTADITSGSLSTQWTRGAGSYNGWSGCGWTGQPLIVRWDDATKAIMNLYDEKKEKEGLVEVIYATLDGYIYFFDLEDGTSTRKPIWMGMNFKGAGSLDPRGYPLMYVGSGDWVDNKAARMYIISLIDGKILYERSGSDGFANRGWPAFDSSPLVDAETDTLIWPGENGILYTVKLNTVYNQEEGTISVSPEETAKIRYSTTRSRTGNYWVGFEPSAVIVDRYLYISENGGMFFCIDLNTMELVWAQDTRDDSNSTPVFEWSEDGTTGYIYTAPSLHWTANSNKEGYISIYKLDAQNGQVVWEKPFDCHTVTDVSGGIQSSPLLGKKGTELEGLIIYTVARLPNSWNGICVAIDTETGETVWEKSMDRYTWSSPVALYTEEGEAYIVLCDSVGNLSLLEGSTGETLSAMTMGSNIEASPAVFEDMIVIGSRGGRICGIKVS